MLNLNTVLSDLHFDSRSHELGKPKLMRQLFCKVLCRFEWNLCVLFGFLYPYECYMDLCKDSSSSSQPTGRPCVLRDKNFNVEHDTQTVQSICFIPVMLMGSIDCYSTHLYLDISFDAIDLHSRSQLYEKSKSSVSIFSQILVSIWMKFNLLPQPVGLLKTMLNLLCTCAI